MNTFEERRSSLHHDRLNNEFLYTMGYNATDAGNEQRGTIMAKAIAGELSQWRRLRRAALLWKPLETDIRRFFDDLTPCYGLELSETFRQEHQGVEAALAAISAIMRKIERGTLEKSDIDAFWAAADKVRLLLGAMARSRGFRAYVDDIRPELVTASL